MQVSIVIQCYNEKNTIEKFFWNRLSNMFINLNLTDMETGYKAFSSARSLNPSELKKTVSWLNRNLSRNSPESAVESTKWAFAT
jgi:hypothetical protein